MKLQKFYLMSGAIALAAITIPAAAAVTIAPLVQEAAILSFTTDTDADARSIAANGAGVAYFFESEAGAGTGNDSLVSLTGSTLAVVATGPTLTAAGNSIIADMDDMVLNAAGDTIYAIVRDTAGTELVVSIALPAGTVTNMVNFPTFTSAPGAVALDIDETNSRLVFACDPAFGDPAIAGVYHVPLNAVNAAPTLLADNTALLAGVTTTGTPTIGISDLAVATNGDVIIVNAFGTTDFDGDVIKVTSAGVVSAFADRDALLTAAGSTSAGTIGDTFIALDPSDNTFVVYINNAPAANPAASFVRLSADGSSASLITNLAAFAPLMAPNPSPTIAGATASLNSTGNGLTVATDGTIIFSSNDEADIEGVFSITETSSVVDWSAL